MKITRLRIENFKRFRAPVEIDGFGPGLNLFAAPNEAGKSTIAAAIRAAFLERHKTGTLEQLRPWGDPGASPSVEIDFEFGGTSYALTKSFLGRKRCDLRVGRRQMDGAEAEDHLAEILGCAMSDRGGARPDTLGIPGLLWIEQGTSQHLDEPLEHARDRLDSVLRAQMSGIATTGGDRLMDSIESARAEIVTEKTGRPKGAYDAAIGARDELRARGTDLAAKIDGYRAKVDRLDQLTGETAKLERDKPWEKLRAKKAEAETRLAAARGLQTRRDAEALRKKSAADRMRILTEQLGTYEREEADAARRRAEHQKAQETAAAARVSVGRLEETSKLAQASADAARATLARARAAAERRRIEADLARLARELEDAKSALAQAQKHQQAIGELRAEAGRIAVPERTLRRIETLSAELHDARIKRDAIATGLSIDLLPGRSIRVDGTTISGSRQITLSAEASIDLPELGTMTVRPGGADLPVLAARIAGQEDELRDLLAGIGATDPAAVQARARRAEKIASELAGLEKLLAIHAPLGASALAAEIAAKEDDLSRARADLDRLAPADPSQEPPPALADAEAEEAATRDELKNAANAFLTAQTTAVGADATAEQIRRDLEDRLTALSAPDRAGRKAGHARDLATAQDELVHATTSLAQLDAALADIDMPTIENDIRRFADSATESETGWRSLRTEVLKLGAVLETEGAAGLEEELAATQRDLGAAERRVAEFERRAAALDLILDLMRQKRAELSRRILAPLQRRLDHYLRMALPGLAVELDESLAPASIHRAGSDRGGRLDEYSIGAREQLGILLRLAYADLLAEAGRPTLLLLDDALVHTDTDRLAGMKRALYDAAARHQFLIFTCHPDAWRDLGVAARALPA